MENTAVSWIVLASLRIRIVQGKVSPGQIKRVLHNRIFGSPIAVAAFPKCNYTLRGFADDSDFNCWDPEGHTPLSAAVRAGNLGVVEDILLKGGIDVNLRNSDWSNALAAAMSSQNVKI